MANKTKKLRFKVRANKKKVKAKKVRSKVKKTQPKVRKPAVSFPANVLQPLVNYLKKEEKRLKGVEKELEEQDPFKDTNRPDDNAGDADVAEQIDHERMSAGKMEVRKALVEIRKTMTRVKLGNYGTCASCGKMVDTDRLAINPTAELCIKCERKQEENKKKKV